MRRLLLVLAIAAPFVLWPAGTLLADPATPTNYESVVTGVEPSDRIAVEIVGGDAFVELTAAPGTEVMVLGYDAEPYIWFHPDGLVEINRNSPATYLNDDRYAQVTLPANADSDAPPDWDQVADAGTYAWHDHRTHWMLSTVPGVVDEAEGGATSIFNWRLPIVVDGEPGQIDGTLGWVPDSTPLPWFGLAIAAAVLTWWVASQRPAGAVGLIVVAGVIGFAAGFGGYLLQPADVRAVDIALIAPVVAAGLAVYAGFRPTEFGSRAFLGIGAAAIGVWGVLRLATLSRPLLPSVLPVEFERFATAMALGVAAGVIVAVALAMTRAGPEPAV